MAYKTLQVRRDTAASWTSNDPTLAAGEIGLETDTNKLKTGDGSTVWTSLNYIDSAINHDNLTGFVANEHTDHTAVSISAGTGLTGGGDISADRSLAVNGVLEDLDTLGASTADGEFLVATGAGALAWESGATARTSIGLDTWTGTTNITTLGTISTVGNITIANGGTIGQAAGPLLTFDDTLNVLEIDNCHIHNTYDGNSPHIVLNEYRNSTAGPNFLGRKARGTESTPLATTQNDCIFRLAGRGHDDSDFTPLDMARIAMFAAENTTSTNRGSYIIFQTTPSGTTNMTTQFRIDDDGGIFAYNMKSGTSQAAAGAAANELWVDTDDANTIKLGT